MAYRISILTYGLFIFFSFQRVGQATRFLPMIVWDNLNPLLKCKSNWLTIPNIDIYDQVDFVCPTLKLNVDLLDSYTRPKSELNVNIFRRKVDENTNMTQLREKLNDGTFCDPTKSVKLKTCNNGVEGQSLTVIFKNQNGYKTNDTFVFFSNGDGKVSTLNSNTKKCTMVFVIKITWDKGESNDVSYGKWLNPKPDQICNNISASCNPTPPCQRKSASVSSVSSSVPSSVSSVFLSPTPTSTIKQQEQSCSDYVTKKLISFNCPTQTCNHPVPTSHNKIQSTTTMKNQTKLFRTNTVLINSSRAVKVSSFSLSCNISVLTCTPVPGARASSNKNYNFGCGIAVGLAIGISTCGVCFLIYLRIFRNIDRKRRSVQADKKLPLDENAKTCETPATGQESDSASIGFDNRSFAPVTPSAPPAELEPVSNNPNNPMDEKRPMTFSVVAHERRLPSVENSSTKLFPSRVSNPSHKVNEHEQELTGYVPLPAIAVKSPPNTSCSSKKHRRRHSHKRKHLPETGTPDTVDTGFSSGIREPPTLDTQK